MTNADCDDFGILCGGGFCGSCSVTQSHSCFQDPITATGTPWQKLVGGGCLAGTANPLIDLPLGLPGPFRIQRGFDVISLCPDGVSRYAEPDGYACE